MAKLGVDPEPEKDENATIRRIWKRLGIHPPEVEWLVVFDNVPEWMGLFFQLPLDDWSNGGRIRETQFFFSDLLDVNRPDSWQTGISILPHVESLLSLLLKEGYSSDAARYFVAAARIAVLFGIFCRICIHDKLRAKRLYEESLEMYGFVYEEKGGNIEIACSIGNLGSVYYDLGNLAKARTLYEDALKMKSGLCGEGVIRNAEIARLLSNLGNVWRHLVEYEKAKNHYRKALDIFFSVNLDIVAVVNNLEGFSTQIAPRASRAHAETTAWSF